MLLMNSLPSLAQIGVTHRRVGLHLLGLADGQDPPEIEDGDAVALRHHEADVVLHEQDGTGLLASDLLDPLAEARRFGVVVLIFRSDV
jgi:hypothetical protein